MASGLMSNPSHAFVSLADTLGFQLRRAAAILKTALEAELEPLGLRASEATVLIYLGENPGRTQSEIGRDLRIKPANMAPIVSRLAAVELITRTPAGGRALALHLTDRGMARLAEVRGVLQAQEARITGRMSPQERDLVIAALKAIRPPGCEDAPG